MKTTCMKTTCVKTTSMKTTCMLLYIHTNETKIWNWRGIFEQRPPPWLCAQYGMGYPKVVVLAILILCNQWACCWDKSKTYFLLLPPIGWSCTSWLLLPPRWNVHRGWCRLGSRCRWLAAILLRNGFHSSGAFLYMMWCGANIFTTSFFLLCKFLFLLSLDSFLQEMHTKEMNYVHISSSARSPTRTKVENSKHLQYWRSH